MFVVFTSTAFLFLSLFFHFSWQMSPAQICIKTTHSHKCNTHLDFSFHCQCLSNELFISPSSPLPSCSAVLPVVQFSDEQLLTVGVAFPAISHFFEDPEGVFLEDIELHTFIPRECVLIYRRGCSDDGSAYEFRIDILSSKYSKFGKVTTAVQPPQLKSLSPLILTKNRSFMMENGLRIAYIRKISSLPIGAQKGADRWEAALISRK